MKIKIKILTALIIIFCSLNSAYTNSGGSIFSRYGLGDIQYLKSSYSEGMAGTGIAVIFSGISNRLNPAALTKVNFTRYSIDVTYQGYSLEDNFNKAYYSSIIFNGFDLAIPVSPENGITIGAGLLPYSTIDYNISSQDTIYNLSYNLSHRGEGGMSIGYLGTSFNYLEDFHVGARFNYIFGTNNHIIKQAFDNDAATGFEMERTTRLHGAGATFGVIYSGLYKMFNSQDVDKLSVGVVLNTGINLQAESERFYSYLDRLNVIARDTISGSEGEIKIPFSVGIGFQYIQNRYHLAADFMNQNWYNSLFFGSKLPELRNSSRFSFGGGILPLKDVKAEGIEKFGFRAGMYYHRTYYKIKGTDINEFGISAGTDFPIIGDTRLNINLQYGIRGEKALVKDNIIRFSIGLNGAERWFVRPVEE